MASDFTTNLPEYQIGEGFTVRLPTSDATCSDEEFARICRLNPNLRFERNQDGSIQIMTPSGGDTSGQNQLISQCLGNWTDLDGSGKAFDSSVCFRFPSGAIRGPDASWIRLSRWNTLTREERRTFPPIVPDFVVELKSPSDGIQSLRKKMQAYIGEGVRLGWLIDPDAKMVEVYRPGEEATQHRNLDRIAGDPELPGFVLDLTRIWSAAGE